MTYTIKKAQEEMDFAFDLVSEDRSFAKCLTCGHTEDHHSAPNATGPVYVTACRKRRCRCAAFRAIHSLLRREP